MLSFSARSQRAPRFQPQPDVPGLADAGLVRLRNVSVDVERTPVLRGLDFDVAAGEAVGVAGANGSGKSTLLTVLATLRVPNRGNGWVLGACLGTGACAAVRPGIALVGHTPALYPQLTLAENLDLLARLLARPVRAAQEALEAVGLSRAAHRRAEQCSQGMQRRADLARVVLAQPQLLLLDEVHAGLDPGAVGLVDDLVVEACRRGGGGVVISHERERLASSTHRVVDIVDGKAIARAGMGELR